MEKKLKHIQKLGIVVSQFNKKVTSSLFEGAMDKLKEYDFPLENIHVAKVPGAVEIPLTSQVFFEKGQVDAVIAIGAIIKGQTDHYDYVCQHVSLGCQNVSLKYNKPVIFCVLTTQDRAQALERAGGLRGNRGADAIEALDDLSLTLENIL